MGNQSSAPGYDSKKASLYSKEEREKLAKNKFACLPCRPFPFTGFGSFFKSGKDDNATPNKKSEPEDRWPLIVSVLSRKFSNVEELCAGMCELNAHNNGNYFKYRYNDPETPEYKLFFGNDGTLEKIQRLALRLPQLFPDEKQLPLLLPNSEIEVTLTQEQIACLLANAFFCILYEGGLMSLCDFNSISFTTLFDGARGTCASTLDCIIHYFERVTQKMPDGVVSFRRQCLQNSDIPQWAESTKPISKVQAIAEGKIEESEAILHADFANEYIGGGVLTGGCVQEEILFAIKPECIASMLFCAKMEPNEAIFITGAERFSCYKGYGRTYTFGGDFVDKTPRDERNRIRTVICAMDACIPFSGGADFTPRLFKRDLHKAYCAFFRRDSSTDGIVATGNWGCGAFGGDKSIKFFQQLIAASEADRELWWFSFDEGYKGRKLVDWIGDMMTVIEKNNMTVGELYKIIKNALEEDDHAHNLFGYFLAYESHQRYISHIEEQN